MAKNFLTETAFEVPGTDVGVPWWGVAAGGIGVVLVLLFIKGQGGSAPAGSQTATDSTAAGGGGGSWLDPLINQTAPEPTLEPPVVPDYQTVERSTLSGPTVQATSQVAPDPSTASGVVSVGEGPTLVKYTGAGGAQVISRALDRGLPSNETTSGSSGGSSKSGKSSGKTITKTTQKTTSQPIVQTYTHGGNQE